MPEVTFGPAPSLKEIEMRTACVFVAALALAIPAAAQTGAAQAPAAQTPANPLTTAMQSAYDE